jgi:hypothetical protein
MAGENSGSPMIALHADENPINEHTPIRRHRLIVGAGFT